MIYVQPGDVFMSLPPLPSLSLFLPSTFTHTRTHTLCRRKDHTLSQPVCETQRQSCSLFSLCNVLVRKTLIFGAAESAPLHHRTILIVNMAFSIFTFHDKKKYSACERLQWTKKNISLLSWCSVHFTSDTSACYT